VKVVAVAAVSSIDAGVFTRELGQVMDRFASRFATGVSFRRAGQMVQVLASPIASKNGWTLAEQAGHDTPDMFQYLLERARWDHDGAVQDLRDLVTERVGTPDAILVIDETGDLKKGSHTVGVQRQYTGTAGRIENSQVAVYLTYATALAHTFIDRKLYLPQSWASDPGRLKAAGVPDGTVFATKPALATQMITAAVHGGVPARWVAGDEVYGADPHLRAACRRLGIGYVLAVACNRQVATTAGVLAVDALTATVDEAGWFTMSAGDGTKGLREYSWALVETLPEADGPDLGSGWHYVLIRKHLATGELAWYRCWSPRPVTPADLVGVAGRRWTIETNFQTAKGLVGLDQHQVRKWVPWHRWTLLAMLTHAFLVLATLTARTIEGHREGLIALTLAETRRLFNALTTHANDLAHTLSWSYWRRRHQHTARTTHYKKRGHTLRL
jgi:SRSO17 transposase